MITEILNSDLTAINILAKRLVETQQKSATLELVGFDQEKHALLEGLIERSKPPIDDTLEARDYLIKTPFRYPPLDHGSRFGTTDQRGIFYASLSKQGLLAEVAYYRFVFLNDLSKPFKDAIVTEHSMFDVRVKSNKVIALDTGRFDAHRDLWLDRANYAHCQALGRMARKAGAEVIRYFSARTGLGPRNLAVIEHGAIHGKPTRMTSIRCTLIPGQVHFLETATNATHIYPIDAFLVEGKLPKPSD